MTLVVANEKITLHFISFLKNRMLKYLISNLNIGKLRIYNDYFNSDKFKKISGGITIKAKDVILLGTSNLVHKRYETTTHIFINPNIIFPGTDLKVVDLCKIINFGTLSIDAYPIFTQMFDHFSKNIDNYIDKCIMGLG